MIARLLISSSVEDRVGEIEKVLSIHELTKNHPDILYFEAGEKLGIEQARKIKEHFSLKPYSAKGRAVVLEDASSLTVEAQNALLKTLEEPPEEAILLLGASSDADLLPTVLSRVQSVILGRSEATTPESQKTDSGQSQNDRYAIDLEKLLQSSLEERFAYIEKLKEREEFLHFMIQFFRQMLLESRSKQVPISTKNVTLEQIKDFLKELLEAEQWVAQNVNIRAILEYLMLVMPKARE